MARRLLGRVVPIRPARLAVEPAEQRPGGSAVAALEDAGRLDAREHASMRGRQTRDLRQLRTVVAVRETLARQLPGLAEVVAAPDAGSVPLACCGSVDRAGIRVVHRVIHRPALALWAPYLPVAPVSVALQDEQALARSHQQDGLRHWSNLHLPTSWVKSRQVRPPGAPELIGATDEC